MGNHHSSDFTHRKKRSIIGWMILLAVLTLAVLNGMAWYQLHIGNEALRKNSEDVIHGAAEQAKAILQEYSPQTAVHKKLPNTVVQAYIVSRKTSNVEVVKGSLDARKLYTDLAVCTEAFGKSIAGKLDVTDRFVDREGNPLRLVYVPLPERDGTIRQVAELVLASDTPEALATLRNRFISTAVASVILTVSLLFVMAHSVLKPVREMGKTLSDVETYNEYILNSMSGGVITVDMKGTVTTFNATAEKMLGIRPEDVEGKGLDQAFPHQRELCNVITRTLRGQARYSRYELEVRTAANRPLSLAVSSTLLKDKENNTIGATLFFDDLTETKRLRKEVALKERLAALGELSAGMAHEIRNPLGGIQLMAGLLKRKLPDRQDLTTLVQDIITEVRVLERIVAEFLDFARPPRLEPKPSRITDVSDQALALCGHVFEEAKAKVKRNYRVPKNKHYTLDPEQIKRALLNLLRNAAQAMTPGGDITLTLNEQEAPATNENSKHEKWLEVEVTNTGSYIPPEHIDKIFNPFFSMTETGTGIGLAIVHKIVENHGGTISVESNKDTGTSFRITLPVIEDTT